MGLFKTFIEYITSSPLKDAKIEIKLLKKQLAIRDGELKVAKEWLQEFRDSYNRIKGKFNNSQNKHAGFLYYRDHYINANNETRILCARIDQLEEIATQTEHLSNMLSKAELEIKRLKYQLKYKPKLKCPPRLRELLSEQTIKDNLSTIKLDTRLQNMNIPNVIDTRGDDSCLTNEFRINSIVQYIGYNHQLMGYNFVIHFINYDDKTATIEHRPSRILEQNIPFSDLQLIEQ